MPRIISPDEIKRMAKSLLPPSIAGVSAQLRSNQPTNTSTRIISPAEIKTMVKTPTKTSLLNKITNYVKEPRPEYGGPLLERLFEAAIYNPETKKIFPMSPIHSILEWEKLPKEEKERQTKEDMFSNPYARIALQLEGGTREIPKGKPLPIEDARKILKVKKNATLDEIKSSYRTLALKYHPDKPGGSEQLFRPIRRAYESLVQSLEGNVPEIVTKLIGGKVQEAPTLPLEGGVVPKAEEGLVTKNKIAQVGGVTKGLPLTLSEAMKIPLEKAIPTKEPKIILPEEIKQMAKSQVAKPPTGGVGAVKLPIKQLQDIDPEGTEIAIADIAEGRKSVTEGAIDVVKTGDGYLVLDGYHRVEGARLAGETTIGSNILSSEEALKKYGDELPQLKFALEASPPLKEPVVEPPVSIEERVLYHGTTPENAVAIRETGFEVKPPAHGLPVIGEGVYLTPTKEEATTFGKEIVEATLKPGTKILKLTLPEYTKMFMEIGAKSDNVEKAITKYVKSLGYGGLEVSNFGSRGETYISVFDPKNIKIKTAKALAPKPSGLKEFLPDIRKGIEETVGETVDYLKSQLGGVQKIPKREGEGYVRMSANPKWYRDWYEELGRQPTEGEWKDMAVDALIKGMPEADVPIVPEFTGQLKEYKIGKEELVQEIKKVGRKRGELTVTIGTEKTKLPKDSPRANVPDQVSGNQFYLARKPKFAGTGVQEFVRSHVPLVRMGNKRGMTTAVMEVLGIDRESLGSIKPSDTAHLSGFNRVFDVFGGSGYLTSLSKPWFENAKFHLNEFDDDVFAYYKNVRDNPKKVKNYLNLIKSYLTKWEGADWISELDRISKTSELKNDGAFKTAIYLVKNNDDLTRGKQISPGQIDYIINSIDNFAKDISDVRISHGDAFKAIDVLSKSGKSTDLVWIDPPYIWSSGYAKGKDLEGSSGFLDILNNLQELKEKGVNFVFFNNEPEIRIEAVRARVGKATGKAKELLERDLAAMESELPALLGKIDELSKNMTVVRHIRPVGAQARQEIIITSLPFGQKEGILRRIKDVNDYVRSMVAGGVMPRGTRVFHAIPSEETKDWLQRKRAKELATIAEKDFKEWQKLIADGTKSKAQNTIRLVNQLTASVREATESLAKQKYRSPKLEGMSAYGKMRDLSAFTAGELGLLDPARAARKVAGDEGYKVLYLPAEKALTAKMNEDSVWAKVMENWKKRLGYSIFNRGDSNLAQQYGEGLIGEAELELRGIKRADEIKAVANEARIFYDDFLDRLNHGRYLLGRDPIPKRKDYITHIQEMNFFRRFRGSLLDTDYSSFINFIKRTAPGNPFAKERKGGPFTSDIIASFDAYYPIATREIYMTQPIRAVRQNLDLLPPNAQKYFNKFANQNLAGESTTADAWVRDNLLSIPLGRQAMIASNWIANRVGKNLIVAHMNTALQQPSSVATTISEIGAKNTIAGHLYYDTREGWNLAHNTCDVLKNRTVVDLPKGLVSVGEKALSAPMDFLDQQMVGGAYLGALKQGLIEKGMEMEDAIIYANDVAGRTQARYSKISRAPIMRHSLIRNTIGMFQTFTVNLFNFAFNDIPEVAKKAGWKEALRMGAGLLVTALVINAIYKKAGLRKPLGLTSFVPFFGSAKFGPPPHVKISSALVNKLLGKPDQYQDDKALKDASFYLLPPYGGYQIKKILSAIKGESRTKGKGSPLMYVLTGESKYKPKKGKLKFKIEGWDILRTLIGGEWSTEAGEKFLVKGGYKKAEGYFFNNLMYILTGDRKYK